MYVSIIQQISLVHHTAGLGNSQQFFGLLSPCHMVSGNHILPVPTC